MMDCFFTSGICSVSIVNEKHNHKMREFFESYKYSEHLKLEEVNLVCEITSTMIFPKNNFMTLMKKSSQCNYYWTCLFTSQRFK